MTEKRTGRNTAVVLAAGSGSRMKAGVAKQFLELAGKPLIYYALRTVEDSAVIDDCILVTGENDMEKMQRDIVERFGFQKVRAIIAGGNERCYSVANAMRWLSKQGGSGQGDYVFIHDGARPFLTEEILERTYEAAKECGACVAAMPSKDTVKLIDEEGFAAETPARKSVWTVQTPQTFERELIIDAYARFEAAAGGSEERGKAMVTDDAGVVETYPERKVKLVEGAYSNLKVTTPEDLIIAEAFLHSK